jgi:hypothetical protein
VPPETRTTCASTLNNESDIRHLHYELSFEIGFYHGGTENTESCRHCKMQIGNCKLQICNLLLLCALRASVVSYTVADFDRVMSDTRITVANPSGIVTMPGWLNGTRALSGDRP